MSRIDSFTTRYSGKEVEVYYGQDGSYSPSSFSSYGGDPAEWPVFYVTDVISDQGKMLFTDRQREKWEEQILENYDPSDEDYDDRDF